MNKINDLKYNLVNKLETIGTNVKHNAHIYAGATLLALASCGTKYTRTIDYDGYIGKDHIKAQKTVRRHRDTPFYNIEKKVENGATINYIDNDNNRVLDNLRIKYPDGKTERYKSGRIFDAANKDYQQIRDTIPILNAAAKKHKDDASAKSDSEIIKKYFK